MGKQTKNQMLLCSDELFVVGHCPHSNFPNNLFASSCDSRRPILQTQRIQTFLKLKTGMWKSRRQRLKARITTAPIQELKSKRLVHHRIQIPSSNYRTRGAMHWR